MTPLIHKILFWIRRWKVKQAVYEYCEYQAERITEIGVYVGGMLLIILTIVTILLCCGCATTQRMPLAVEVKPFSLYVVEPSVMGTSRGLCNVESRTIIVHWMGDTPDFYVLGHEVWHLSELGGKDFHK